MHILKQSPQYSKEQSLKKEKGEKNLQGTMNETVRLQKQQNQVLGEQIT